MLLFHPTGAGIFVLTGDGSVPVGPLSNNGVVIAQDVSSGNRIRVQCRSGSPDFDVGQFVDLDGTSHNIPGNTGDFDLQRSGTQLGTFQFLNRAGIEPALTADDNGVYTCHIPDESGNDVDVNIGIFQNGFTSELGTVVYTMAIISYTAQVPCRWEEKLHFETIR